MDFFIAAPYVRRDMLRRLLACLALLTGLTAAGAPVHAQIASELSAPVEASASRAAVRSSVPIVVRRDFTAGSPSTLDSSVGVLHEAPARLAPSVRTRIDRARE